MLKFEFPKHMFDDVVKESLRRSSEISEIYAKELPPPSPELDIITVVPACNELDNDNFWRLIRSAATQTVSGSNFEILYILNQKRSVMGQIRSSENHRTLKILEAMRECRQRPHENIGLKRIKSLGLSEWEGNVFSLAVQRKIAIYPIFVRHNIKVGPGRKFFPQGMARDIGAAIALGRFNKIGKLDRGMIDFVDADCFLPADYFSRMRKDLTKPYKRKILLPVSPDIPNAIEKIKDPIWRLVQIIKFLKFSFIKARARYLITSDDMAINSGPALAVQAETFAKVGKYPSVTSIFTGEDLEFATNVRSVAGDLSGEDLISDGDSSPYLYLSQRQALTSTDGATYAELARDRKPQVIGDEFEAIKNNTFFDRLVDLKRIMKDVLEKDRVASQDPKYIKLRAKWFKREKIRRSAFQRIFKAILEGLEGKHNKLTSRARDYFESQPAVLKSITELFKIVKQAKKDPINSRPYLGEYRLTGLSDTALILNFLKTYLPEYFSDLGKDEPDYQKLIESIEKSQHHDLSWIAHVSMAIAEYSHTQNGLS